MNSAKEYKQQVWFLSANPAANKISSVHNAAFVSLRSAQKLFKKLKHIDNEQGFGRPVYFDNDILGVWWKQRHI